MQECTPMKRIERLALILDFGGVITKTLFEQHRHTEQILGLPVGCLSWLGPLDPDSDELWRCVQRSEMTERDYWLVRTREVGLLVGENWHDVATLLHRSQGDDPNATVRPEAMAMVCRIRAAGIRLAVLSNELERFYGPKFRSTIDVLSAFDVIIDGTRTNVIKPDRRAYELCLQSLGVEARQAVFVDDQLRNVDASRALGMEAKHFDIRHPARSCAEIEDLFLGQVPTTAL